MLSRGTLYDKSTRYIEIVPEKIAFHTLVHMALIFCLRNGD